MLVEAEQRFHLIRTEDERFFQNWYSDLPNLADAEQSGLVELCRRYLYQRSLGHLLESTVMPLFASPWLTLAGFYDPPFHLKAEEAVQLTLADSEEILQGRLDVLVLKDCFWVVVLESKKTLLGDLDELATQRQDMEALQSELVRRALKWKPAIVAWSLVCTFTKVLTSIPRFDFRLSEDQFNAWCSTTELQPIDLAELMGFEPMSQ